MSDHGLGRAREGAFHLDNLDGPTLTAGQSYWLQAEKPENAAGAHNWRMNDQGYKSTFAARYDDDPWIVWDVADVRGLRARVTPEPAAAWLLLVGAPLLHRPRRA